MSAQSYARPPPSQGCVADYAVVMANLVMGGKSLGPHAFVMQV